MIARRTRLPSVARVGVQVMDAASAILTASPIASQVVIARPPLHAIVLSSAQGAISEAQLNRSATPFLMLARTYSWYLGSVR